MGDEKIRKILTDAKNIAVVGCSSTPGKAAHDVPQYLQEKGYEILPVNPYSDEILGKKSYDSLEDVVEKIDVVDVFRPSEEVYDIVKDALKTDAETIWMQLGIENEKAKELAEKNGLNVVQDKCMKIEYRNTFEN